MTKKFLAASSMILILLLTVTLVFFAGCRDEVNIGGLEEESISVVDGDGNTVELGLPAEKIVVLAPSALEIIDGLGAMEKVVEVDSWSVTEGDPLAEGFEGAGDSYGPNIERIAELNPDILITPTGGPEDDFLKISELGIKIYRVIDIEGIEGVYEEITNISKIIGLEDKGEEMVGELKKEVDQIYGQVRDLSDAQRPRVFLEINSDPLMTVGGDTYISDLIEKSGGVNIAAEDNLTGWPEYSVERLIEIDPDIMIVPISLASDPSIITEDARFSSLAAVSRGRIYIVPDNPIFRPSQNLIEKGLPMLSRAIHPEIFGEFEIME